MVVCSNLIHYVNPYFDPSPEPLFIAIWTI